MPNITFEPSGRSVRVSDGASIRDAAAAAGIQLRSPCGGGGTCGKCRVRIARGTPRLIAPADEPGLCLACKTLAGGTDLVVEIPDDSLEGGAQQILTASARLAGDLALAPSVRVVPLALGEPSRDDPRPDLQRLCDAAGTALDLPLALLRRLPGILRDSAWNVALVLDGDSVLDIFPAASARRCCGMAFDLGTTTVVGSLYDLKTGERLAAASALNPQIPLGDDVLARIEASRHGDGGTALQAAAARCIGALVADACAQAGTSPEDVYQIVVAGNTTMQQLLAGLDCGALASVPFVPVFRDALRVSAAALGIAAHPNASVWLFPQIGGFVGGDTAAGILAANLDHVAAPTLFLDIGTNGEIVLALPGGRLLATSTAAGPAFEGARISCGMRATRGAIDSVALRDGDLRVTTIGNAPAAGLCGTALIDAVAAFLDCGMVDATGRILDEDELPDGLPAALRARLSEDDDGPVLVLAPAADGRSAVVLTQRDIRELQLAAGALRAGSEILLARAGLTTADLGAVLLAGAFGNYIRKANALRIGILPAIDEERVAFIGNAASEGAVRALLSTSERGHARTAAARAEHVDLGTDPEFQNAFGMAMIFPDPDGDL